MPPTILVTAAAIHPDAVALLADYRLVYADTRASEDELAALCAHEKPVAIMVRYGRISAKVIAAAGPGLKVIAKHGVGIDNIDRAAAEALGIPVLAALGSNSQSVAEYTIGLMIACARSIARLDARMRAGHWDRDDYHGTELSRATLGLIGFGSIGQRVAGLATAFGMKVLVRSPSARLEGGVYQPATIDEIVDQADIISLHCPLTEATRSTLHAARIARLKPGAILINTSRAELIDEAPLLEALHAGRILAAMDCFIEEPLPATSPLRSVPNLILTPHVAGTSAGALRAMGMGAAQHILDRLKAG